MRPLGQKNLVKSVRVLQIGNERNPGLLSPSCLRSLGERWKEEVIRDYPRKTLGFIGSPGRKDLVATRSSGTFDNARLKEATGVCGGRGGLWRTGMPVMLSSFIKDSKLACDRFLALASL
jgi:hypothetical protein